MLTATLAYVTLVVSDVDAAANVLQRDFGLQRSDCRLGEAGMWAPLLHIGECRLVLVEPGDPFVRGELRMGVDHIGLAVEDITVAVDMAISNSIGMTEPVKADGIDGGLRVLLDPEVTAGVKTYFVEPLKVGTMMAPAETQFLGSSMQISHRQALPYVVERLDHIGVASADNTLAIETFSKRLGFMVESTQTDTEIQLSVESFTSDKYGVVYHNRPPEPVGGLRVAFITIGDCELEFLQDFDPNPDAHVAHGQAGTTRQDRGAIARYVWSHGPGLHHLAIKVSDTNSALNSLHEAGHAVIDAIGRPGSRQSRIGFVHPKSLYGILLHVVQRVEL